VRQKDKNAKDSRNERVPVGKPAGRKTVDVVQRKEESGQPRNPRAPNEPTVEQRGQEDKGAEPEKALRVHQHGVLRPEKIIDPLCGHREGTPE
jgi:hypothetical protein